ncbi:MAG TPA: hypothetical protein VFN23_04795 [Ktedonobacteraceae bacterium]|nr:hypothetical protein [Ktedonobacteraceae bacterium]
MSTLLSWLKASEHPRFWHAIALVVSTINFLAMLASAWNRSLSDMLFFVSCFCISLWLIHVRMDDDEDNDPGQEDDPDMPDGDAVDRWLRQRQTCVPIHISLQKKEA